MCAACGSGISVKSGVSQQCLPRQSKFTVEGDIDVTDSLMLRCTSRLLKLLKNDGTKKIGDTSGPEFHKDHD
jgi:hypothetical protein